MIIEKGFVSLDNIRFHVNHGVLEQERLTGGDFTVSVKAGYPLTEAVMTDNVDTTLNYATLYEIIDREMRKPSRLLEHVAGRIGESIFTALPLVDSLVVKITKVNPPMGGLMDGASVELHLINDKNSRQQFSFHK